MKHLMFCSMVSTISHNNWRNDPGATKQVSFVRKKARWNFLKWEIVYHYLGSAWPTAANNSLSNYLKTLGKRGDIATTAHKQVLTKEMVEKLYHEGELVEFDMLNPGKLQQTVWFFISLFLGKRGRENQHIMKKTMLASRKTPVG